MSEGSETSLGKLLTNWGDRQRRSIDTFQLYDPSKANWECKCMAWVSVVWQAKNNLDVSHVEGLIPKQFGLNAVEVHGARLLLASLEKLRAPWAIVTSGTRPLVTGVRPLLTHDLPITLGLKHETCIKSCTLVSNAQKFYYTLHCLPWFLDMLPFSTRKR